MRGKMRKTNLSVDQILLMVQSGTDARPRCFWISELAVRAMEDGDPKAEAELRWFLIWGGEEEKYAAYQGLRGMKSSSQETWTVLDIFEKVPQNERFMVPPQRRREVV